MPDDRDYTERARDIFRTWMQSRPAGAYQASIMSTEATRLIGRIAAALSAVASEHKAEIEALRVTHAQTIKHWKRYSQECAQHEKAAITEKDAARLEDLRRRHCSIVSSHRCDEKAIGGWPPCDAAFLLRLLDEARLKLEASNYALDRVREQRERAMAALPVLDGAIVMLSIQRAKPGHPPRWCALAKDAKVAAYGNTPGEAIRAAIDGAANTAGDAVTTEEER